MISRKEFISSVFLLLFTVLFSIVYLPISLAWEKSPHITIQFVVVAIIAVLGMISSTRKKNFSISMIFWFFCFAFMFCGGLTQFAKNAFQWEFVPTTDEIERANYYLIAFMCIFAIANSPSLKIKKYECQKRRKSWLYSNIRMSIPFFIFMCLALITLGIIPIIKYGADILFIRSKFEVSSIASFISNSSLSILVVALLRGLSMALLLISLSELKKHRSFLNFYLVVLACLVCFLHIPPLGVARYTVAYVYGSAFLLAIPIAKKKRVLLCLLFVGLLVIFPAMNAFRGLYTENVTLEFLKQNLGNISDNFATPDYDSYTMLVYTVRYIDSFGITWGTQLLGVAFFFVPRFIWSGKAGGSGATIIENLAPSYINPNVSCPIIGEAIINFGWIGVFLFAIALGVIFKSLDRYYWTYWHTEHCFGNLLYPVLVFFILFMMRGDLMSSFAYCVGIVVSLFCVSMIFKKQKVSGKGGI